MGLVGTSPHSAHPCHHPNTFSGLTVLVMDGFGGGELFSENTLKQKGILQFLPPCRLAWGPRGEQIQGWREEGGIDSVTQATVRLRDLSPAPRSPENSQISSQAFSIRHGLPMF